MVLDHVVLGRVELGIQQLHLLDPIQPEDPDLVGRSRSRPRRTTSRWRTRSPVGQMIRTDGSPRRPCDSEPHSTALAERFAQAAEMLQVARRGECRDAQVARDLLVGQLGDDCSSRYGAVDRAALLPGPLRLEHRQPQLQRAQLTPGEPHRPEEVVGDDGDRVGVEKDLEALDEPAGHLEPLGDGLDVLQQQRAVDPDLTDQRR